MLKPKIILGIESSCDETAAAVVQTTEDGVKILSNVVASSADLQSKYGGVIPEQAAREQLKSIIPVIQEAFSQSQVPSSKLDAIAVTFGPGLIGSLLVGVETAKTLSLIWNKPLIPVNHLLGHFYANWIVGNEFIVHDSSAKRIPGFPAIGLLVSGGHTDLILIKDHGVYEYLGGTRDDAAGEAFDKTARLLGLPYPGGPVIAKLAEKGNPKAFKLPRPMINSSDFDFSFSGLKTAVSALVNSGEFAVGSKKVKEQPTKNNQQLSDLAASVQEAIVDVLISKTIAAAQKYNIEQIMLAGGVAANHRLSESMLNLVSSKIPRAKVFIPEPKLCTDNAAYVATTAFYNYKPIAPLTLQADPNLSLSS